MDPDLRHFFQEFSAEQDLVYNHEHIFNVLEHANEIFNSLTNPEDGLFGAMVDIVVLHHTPKHRKFQLEEFLFKLLLQ